MKATGLSSFPAPAEYLSAGRHPPATPRGDLPAAQPWPSRAAVLSIAVNRVPGVAVLPYVPRG
jgi:hypothetical protein